MARLLPALRASVRSLRNCSIRASVPNGRPPYPRELVCRVGYTLFTACPRRGHVHPGCGPLAGGFRAGGGGRLPAITGPGEVGGGVGDRSSSDGIVGRVSAAVFPGIRPDRTVPHSAGLRPGRRDCLRFRLEMAQRSPARGAQGRWDPGRGLRRRCGGRVRSQPASGPTHPRTASASSRSIRARTRWFASPLR